MISKILFIFVAIFIQITFAYAQDKIAHDAIAFGTLPEISDVKISPDGSKILYLQNHQGRKILVTRSLENPELPQNGIPPIGNQEFLWADWANNNRVIAGLRFPDVVDFSQYADWKYNIEVTQTRLIAMDWDGENAINPIKTLNQAVQPIYQDGIIDIMEDDPDHVLLQLRANVSKSHRLGEFKKQRLGVYKLNISQKRNLRRNFGGMNSVNFWKTDKDYKVRYGRGFRSDISANKTIIRAYYRKSEDDKWMTLYQYDEVREVPPFYFEGFSQDPNIIYITMDDENGKRNGYTYDVNKKEVVDLIASHEIYDINAIYLDEDDNLEYYTYVGESNKIVYFDNHDLTKAWNMLVKSFPDKSIDVNSRTRNRNIVVLKVSAPTEPGTFYLFDVQNKKLEMLGYNYQKVDIEKLSEMKPISYRTRDGLSINGYVSLPTDLEHKNLPTVILPHGGPAARDSWKFDWWVQFLTNQGYAVLQMNYRGSTGYGDQFRELGNSQWGEKMLDDINDGTKWMIEQGYTDPNRICIAGGSYGGYAALQAIVKDQSLYKCSVSMAPVTDLDILIFQARNWANYYIVKNYIRSDQNSFDDISPIHNIDKINVPVFLFHGELDRRVDVAHSRNFYEKMKEAGKDVNYIEWEGGDHFFSKEKDRIQFLEEMGRFLKEHL